MERWRRELEPLIGPYGRMGTVAEERARAVAWSFFDEEAMTLLCRLRHLHRMGLRGASNKSR
jgi:hypothetical protein